MLELKPSKQFSTVGWPTTAPARHGQESAVYNALPGLLLRGVQAHASRDRHSSARTSEKLGLRGRWPSDPVERHADGLMRCSDGARVVALHSNTVVNSRLQLQVQRWRPDTHHDLQQGMRVCAFMPAAACPCECNSKQCTKLAAESTSQPVPSLP